MQAILNETDAVFHRRTHTGRELIYKLSVIQPPIRARACGSGDKAGSDRRPVDPPPVVQMNIFNNGQDITSTYESQFMLYAGLEHARPFAKGQFVPTNHFAVLKGSNVAGAAYLAKPVNAAYFIFPDLSVQHEGYYRLKFQLYEQPKDQADWSPERAQKVAESEAKRAYLDEQDCPPPADGIAMEFQTHVYSKPFQVYSAKKFPGLTKSTELSKIIAEQGCRVRIRRDIRQRKGGKTKDSESSAALDRADSYSEAGASLNNDPWSRPALFETRRPSTESLISPLQSYGPSRQHSYGHVALQSPIVPSTQQRSMSTHAPSVAESVDLFSPVIRTPHELPPMQLQSHRPHYQHQPAPRPAAEPISLPSISSLLNSPQVQEQSPYQKRPEGLYQTNPMVQKRGYTEPREERRAPLKDRARPQLTPTSRMSPYVSLVSQTNRTPLVGGNQIIEADDADEEDDDDESVDLFLQSMSTYRRADGTRNPISYSKMSFQST